MRFSWVLSVLSIATATYAAEPTTLVDLGYAKYQGVVNGQGDIEFLGIRYAASPTGTLRWREPQLPELSAGVQLANTNPSQCWQTGGGTQPVPPFPLKSHTRRQAFPSPAESEDCLFLNVVTPASGTGSLPVLVWIHGGGYALGNVAAFDGNDLVRQAGEGVVTVLIQYRLGLFGFLSSQKIHDDGVLNAGLLDQQFALQWVQRHISKFGGDPTKVTIWGQSAGAGSVLQHVIANNGNTQPPLFRAAITSSTYLPSQYTFNSNIPEQIFSAVANQTGCSSGKDSLNCLRQADISVLSQVNLNIANSGFFGTSLLAPVVDGTFITKRPTELLREGKLNGDALLAVTNTFEGSFPGFVDNSTEHDIPSYLKELFPGFTEKQVAAGTAEYLNRGTSLAQAQAIMGESIFICPTYYLLRAFKGKAFKGEFAIPPGFHGQDLLYYFPGTFAGPEPAPFKNTVFVNNFDQSFLNFALAMDPNVKWDPSNSVPRWNRWTEEGRTEMLFNKTEGDVPVFKSVETAGDLLQRCDFWDSVGAFSAQ